MRASFLDDRNLPLIFTGILIGLPAMALLFGACSQPRTPEEKAEAASNFAERLKEGLITLSPRPGVECYVIRGASSTSPRVMSCVVIPKESN